VSTSRQERWNCCALGSRLGLSGAAQVPILSRLRCHTGAVMLHPVRAPPGWPVQVASREYLLPMETTSPPDRKHQPLSSDNSLTTFTQAGVNEPTIRRRPPPRSHSARRCAGETGVQVSKLGELARAVGPPFVDGHHARSHQRQRSEQGGDPGVRAGGDRDRGQRVIGIRGRGHRVGRGCL